MLGEWFNTDDRFYVEACLIQHPSILECAVVPARDSENLVKSWA